MMRIKPKNDCFFFDTRTIMKHLTRGNNGMKKLQTRLFKEIARINDKIITIRISE